MPRSADAAVRFEHRGEVWGHRFPSNAAARETARENRGRVGFQAASCLVVDEPPIATATITTTVSRLMMVVVDDG